MGEKYLVVYLMSSLVCFLMFMRLAYSTEYDLKLWTLVLCIVFSFIPILQWAFTIFIVIVYVCDFIQTHDMNPLVIRWNRKEEE